MRGKPINAAIYNDALTAECCQAIVAAILILTR
jgi:hypothetical protein